MGWGDDAYGDSSTSVSLATLISRVREWLEDLPPETYATQGSTSTSASLYVQDPTLLAKGMVLEDQATLEMMLVRSADPQSSPLTVKRAHRGSTAAVVGAQDIILMEPRFPGFIIQDALLRLVTNGLNWPYAWKAGAVALTPSTTANWYDAGTGARGLIAVTQLSTSTPVNVAVYGPGSGYPVKFASGLPTALVASGNGVIFPNGLYDVTQTIHLSVAQELTINDITDGLMADALTWGACARLLGAKDIPRTGSDTSMGDATVQPGAQQRSAMFFQGKFERARRELKTYLNSTIPVMST